MEEFAYLTSIVASAFYLAASARLLRLHRQTGERPELLLGGTEIASVLVLWLAFFPLPFYANWIAHRAAIPSTSVEA